MISEAQFLFACGQVEEAICKLEKAEKDYLSYNLHNQQVEIFFACSFGAMYDSLGFYMQAMTYYLSAKAIGDKLVDVNPDKALSLNGIG